MGSKEVQNDKNFIGSYASFHFDAVCMEAEKSADHYGTLLQLAHRGEGGSMVVSIFLNDDQVKELIRVLG